MQSFFQDHYTRLVDSPNQAEIWWHSLPLPDGSRINGYNPDKDFQFKMWRAMQIPNRGGLQGKRVLDIGANDGFFTIAALKAGAAEATAIDMDWGTFPRNIQYASDIWQVAPKIIKADFRAYDFQKRFDVIFFLGVLYHLENVFECMLKLDQLLEPNGVIYLETQISQIQGELPVFEYASDILPTVVRQSKAELRRVGLSNYLFPNDAAICNLAYSYDFKCDPLDGPHNIYTQENPTRRFYKLTRV